MFFFGIGVCKGGPSPVTGDTRALSSSLSIFILPWSRVSRASTVRRGSSPPSSRGFAQFSVRRTAEVSWKI